MRIGLLLVLLLMVTRLCGQSQADSLKRELTRLDLRRPGFARDTMRVRVLCDLATATKEWSAARVYWQYAIDVSEKINWTAGRLEAYRGMGKHLVKKSLYANATYFYYKGLNLAETSGDLRYLGEGYRVLGIALDMADDYAAARRNHAKAIGIARKFGDKFLYLNALNSLGSSYYRSGDYGKALGCFTRCVRENQPVDSVQQCWFLTNIAATYRDLRRYDSAGATYRRLLHYGRYLAPTDSAYALADLAMTSARMNKADDALRYGQRALSMVPGLTGGFTIAHVYEAASEAYQANGRWPEALRHYRSFIAMRDSTLHQEERQRLEGMRMMYENEKQKAALALAQGREADHRRSNRLLWMGVGSLGLLGAVLVVTNYLLRRRRLEIERQKSQIEELNGSLERRVAERTAELQSANEALLRKNREIEEALFKGQRLERKRVASELHDNLGGTLAAIKWKVEALLLSELDERERKIYEDVHRMIKQAYGEVRLLSHNFMPAVLEKEGIEQAFVQLSEQVNRAGRMRINVRTQPVDGLLDARQRLELYSVGMELITNVLKHAQATECNVTLTGEANCVELSIADDGVGLPPEEMETGMGLKNINARIGTIGGTWRIQTGVRQGTTVVIRIPVGNHPAPDTGGRADDDRPSVENQTQAASVR
jgi:signal transduction histidine kinase